MTRTIPDIDRSLRRSADRLAFYRVVDHRSARIERLVIDRLLDERNHLAGVTR